MTVENKNCLSQIILGASECDLAVGVIGRKNIDSIATHNSTGELFSSVMPRGSPTKSHPVLGLQCHWAMRTAGIAEFQCGLEKISPAPNTTNDNNIDTNSAQPNSNDIFVDNSQVAQQTPRQVDTTVVSEVVTTTTGETFSCMGDFNNQNIHNILTSYTYIKNRGWTAATQPLPSIPDETTTIDDSDVMTCDFPGEYLEDSLVKSKVEYFNYWKSDVEFEVKVNNAPTQQGCLYLWYEPMRGANFPIPQGIQRAGLAQLTSYPGTMLNLETTDTATLRVPFMWYQEYFDLTLTDTMGRFHVSVLAPLDGESASTEVELVLNIRCINPDLRVPTTKAVAARAEVQMGPEERIRIRTLGSIYQEEFEDEGYCSMDSEDECEDYVAEMQMGPEEPRGGKITQLADGITHVANTAEGFPILAPLARTVGWVSRMVGNVSNALGFSKPFSVQETKPVYRIPGFGLQQVEGVTPGLSLGAIQDNEIKHTKSGVDEMSIDNMCSRPVVISSQPIALTEFNVKGDTWYSTRTHPIPDDITYPVGPTEDTISGGPMQLVAAQFDLWRGTLVYDFELIKTKFHKGRLQVSWLPGVKSDPGAININKAYTKIWDVGVSSKFQFKVPFVLPYGYANVSNDRKFNTHDQPGYTGLLVVKVFNKFNYPDTVPHNLTLLVSLSGEDMDFQVPFMNSRLAQLTDLMPGPDPPPPSTKPPVAKKPLIAETQSGYEDKFNIPFVNDRIGGEKITSFRQLLKKHAPAKGARWDECYTLALATTFSFYSGSFSEFLNGHAPNHTINLATGLSSTDPEFISNTDYPFILSSDGATFVKVPYYCKFPCLPTKSVYNRSVNSGASGYFKAIGDDYHAWYLVAPPTIVLKRRTWN